MRMAIIDSTTAKVINVIVGDQGTPVGSSEYLVALEPDERCEIGQDFDPLAMLDRFSGTPYRPPQSWTAYQFLLRFTAEERAAFRAAAITDPNVADFQQLAQAAQEVLSDDPMTVAGMAYLVSVGLLTSARRDEILGG
jgi:hypothetical protein